MKTFKGTKGSWKIENVTTHNGDYFKVMGDISVCNITTRNRELAKANAKLIASAPELLEALIAVHSRFRGEADRYIKAAHVIDMAEKAIKKAL